MNRFMLILCLLVCTTVQAQKNAVKWKHIHNADGKYTLTIPENWNEVNASKGVFQYRGPLPGDTTGKKGFFIIGIYDELAAKSTTAQVVDRTIAGMKSDPDITNLILRYRKATQIGGKTWTELSFSCTMDDAEMENIQWFYVYRERLYMLVACMPLEEALLYEGTVRTVAESFTLKR